MAGRFSFLASLLGTTAAAPAAGTDGADPLASLELSADDQALLGREVQAFVTEQTAAEHGKGFKAATERFTAVMASDKGKANPTAALQLLGNEKLAALTAAEIEGAIPDAAAAAPPPPAAAAEEPAAGSPEHQKRLAASPKVALGNRATADPAIDGADDDGSGARASAEQTTALWGSVQTPGDTKISKAA